jgi:prophage regulatory protein
MVIKDPKEATPREKDSSEPEFLRQSILLKHYLPFSAATLWRLIKGGRFPRPVKLTSQITAWRCAEVKSWAEDPEGYSVDTKESRK